MSAQLVLLMDAQTQMARAASLQLEDRERQRPTWLAWGQAIFLLVISGSFVFNGILIGQIGTTKAATTNTLQAQANSAINQANRAMQPVSNLITHKGAKWVVAHATKADVTDVTTAARLVKVYNADSNAASADQTSADRYQLAGPALLAFGSALSGAVLGWILVQWFGALRWPKKRETRAP